MAKGTKGDDTTRAAGPAGGREYQYRGQRIAIQDAPDMPRDGGERQAAVASRQEVQPKLAINGREVPVERTEGGYLSHDFMFKEYGTLDEMAEDLIRQWGTAQIETRHEPHDPGTQHDEDTPHTHGQQ